ncbi:MAG: hypothetical protein QXO76_02995 [Thermoproteota archaeon]
MKEILEKGMDPFEARRFEASKATSFEDVATESLSIMVNKWNKKEGCQETWGLSKRWGLSENTQAKACGYQGSVNTVAATFRLHNI